MSSEEETRSIGKQIYSILQNKCNSNLSLPLKEEQEEIAKLLYQIPDQTIRRLIKKHDEDKLVCTHCDEFLSEHSDEEVIICNAWVQMQLTLTPKRYPKVNLSDYFERIYSTFASEFEGNANNNDYAKLTALIEYSLLRQLCMDSQGRITGYEVDRDNPNSPKLIKFILSESRTCRHHYLVKDSRTE
jgi:hypothetical protein